MSTTITIQDANGNITTRAATPQEEAALIHRMSSVYNFGVSQPGPGAIYYPPGGKTQYNDPKQPQDKVLRLVMARGDEKFMITECVIACVGASVISFGAGMVGFPWWLAPIALLASCLPMVVVAWIIKQVFKRGEARADLLDWPQK